MVVRSSKYIKGPVSVYNFSVEVNHNYFVSSHKLWVHNANGSNGGCDWTPDATTRLPVPKDLPTNIHMGQQGKHIRGHNNYIEGRSYLIEGIGPGELLDGVHSGKYPIVGNGSRGNPIVEFGRPIGVDGRTGEVVTRGQIHYGKNGAHIVPDARN